MSGRGSVLMEHPDGAVLVEDLDDGRRRVSVRATGASQFVSRAMCETSYRVDLIQRLLDVKGPRALCDEILRDEDENYVALNLRYAFLAYLPPERFSHCRLLDFGCGAGSSTLVLARMLPQTGIVGVDFDATLLGVARYRAHRLGVAVGFECSPSPDTLPDGLGTFDFIALCAVYEHLLTSERPRLLSQLWELLRPGGILFLNGTPNRYYPVEGHTTGLPLLNYLPAGAAFHLARRFSRQWCRGGWSWQQMLRTGIRGATRGEILRYLVTAGTRPELLTPTRLGCRDEIDLWYAPSMARNPRSFKRAMRSAFKLYTRVTGSLPTPDLNIAVRKPLNDEPGRR